MFNRYKYIGIWRPKFIKAEKYRFFRKKMKFLTIFHVFELIRQFSQNWRVIQIQIQGKIHTTFFVCLYNNNNNIYANSKNVNNKNKNFLFFTVNNFFCRLLLKKNLRTWYARPTALLCCYPWCLSVAAGWRKRICVRRLDFHSPMISLKLAYGPSLKDYPWVLSLTFT